MELGPSPMLAKAFASALGHTGHPQARAGLGQGSFPQTMVEAWCELIEADGVLPAKGPAKAFVVAL